MLCQERSKDPIMNVPERKRYREISNFELVVFAINTHTDFSSRVVFDSLAEVHKI